MTKNALSGTGLGVTAGAPTGARTACLGSACTTTTWVSWTPVAGPPPRWKRRCNPPPLRTAPCRPRGLSPWTRQWSRAPTTATIMAACSAQKAGSHSVLVWVWHASQHELHCFATAAVREQVQCIQYVKTQHAKHDQGCCLLGSPAP